MMRLAGWNGSKHAISCFMGHYACNSSPTGSAGCCCCLGTRDWAKSNVQAEILDESDIYEDVNRRVIRRDRERADIASYLAMFEHKLHATALSSSEMAAVAAFLVLNVEEFAPLLAPHDMPLKVCH